MPAAALSWKNHATDYDGFVTAEWTAGTEDSTKPAANVLDPDVSLVTATEAITTTACTLKVSFSADDVPVRVVALLNCRIPSADGLGSIVMPQWLGGVFITNREIYDFTVTGAIMVPIPGTTDRYNVFYFFDSALQCSDVAFTFSWLTTPNDYVEIGHVWVGDALPLDGIDAQWEHLPFDPSPVERGPSGGFSSRVQPIRNVLQASITGMTYEQAMGDPDDTSALSYRQMTREAGRSSPVLIIPSNASIHELQTMSIYGLFSNPPSYPHRAGRYFNSAFVLDEVR